MAILKNGINGGFSGKAGTTVGKIVRGQQVITGPYDKTKVPFSDAQLLRQKYLGAMSNFLCAGSDLIALGFKPKKEKHKPMNLAIAYNLKHAITGGLAEVEILYPQVVWSIGDLKNPLNFEITALPGAAVKFSWTLSTVVSCYAGATDRLMVLVYNATKDKLTVKLNVAERADLMYILQLHPGFAGDQLHCYCFFAGYRGMTSNSLYAQVACKP